MQAATIRIATRGSALALAQAHEARRRLMAAHGLPEERFEIRVIKTSGDRIQDRPLADAGGKGLFTKEIEEALIKREADLAVHSMKDMTSVLPAGLAIGAVLERADVRDALISLKYRTLRELPAGATLGTSSLRRRAQVLRLRPDLKIVEFRGMVLAPDGSASFEARRSGTPASALRLGEEAAEEVLANAGPEFLAGIR